MPVSKYPSGISYDPGSYFNSGRILHNIQCNCLTLYFIQYKRTESLGLGLNLNSLKSLKVRSCKDVLLSTMGPGDTSTWFRIQGLAVD